MSDEQDMIYDAPMVRDPKTGQLMTPLNPNYPVANHKTEHRRNPTTAAGTSSHAVKVRNVLGSMDGWTPGVLSKFALTAGQAAKAEEQEVLGIDGELTADPDLIMIDSSNMHSMAIEDILAIVEYHKAMYLHMSTNKGSKKTNGHGYRRLKAVHQRFTQKLGLKNVLVIFVQTTKNMLKQDLGEGRGTELYGNILKSVIRKFMRLGRKQREMEKTAGTRLVNAYIANQPDGLEIFEILNERSITKVTEGKRAGDGLMAFDISAPIYTEVEE